MPTRKVENAFTARAWRTMAMKKGTCEFCGDQDVWINEEHVWPVWLGLAVLEGVNAPRLRISKGDVIGAIRKIRPKLNITAHCACKQACNGGWMRQLEGDIAPLMEPMAVDGRLTLLDDSRRALLAAWCVKTAMVHEFLDRDRIKYFTPAERLHAATYREPPEGVRIWLGFFNDATKLHSCPVVNRLKAGSLAPTSYALTLVAGKVLLQMLAVRDVQMAKESTRPRLDGVPPGMLIEVWPRSSPGLDQWPTAREVNHDNLDSFDHRFWPRDGDAPL